MAAKFIWYSLHKKVSIWASLYPMQNFWFSTSGLHSWHSRLLFAISSTSISIWWSPSYLPVDIIISWPWWTILPDSQKQFPSRIKPHPHMPERWSYIRFPILVFLWYVVWQWVAVHIKDLGIHLKVARHQAPSHHILLSRVQWSHRAFPSPHELRPVSLFSLPWMDRQAAMGAFGNQDSSQGGIGMFSSELVYGAPLTVTGNFIANNGASFQLQRLENR